MTKSEAGRLGGRALVAYYGKEYMAEIGMRGGLAVLMKYGPNHLANIRKKHKK